MVQFCSIFASGFSWLSLSLPLPRIVFTFTFHLLPFTFNLYLLPFTYDIYLLPLIFTFNLHLSPLPFTFTVYLVCTGQAKAIWDQSGGGGQGSLWEDFCVKTIMFFCIFLRDRPFRLENLRVTLTVCDK